MAGMIVRWNSSLLAKSLATWAAEVAYAHAKRAACEQAMQHWTQQGLAKVLCTPAHVADGITHQCHRVQRIAKASGLINPSSEHVL